MEDSERGKRDLLPVTVAQPEGWETKSNAACMDEWTVSDVGVLLTGLGLGQVRDAFEKNDVDGFVFERLVGNLDDVEDDEMLATPSNAAGDTPDIVHHHASPHSLPNSQSSNHRSHHESSWAAKGAHNASVGDGGGSSQACHCDDHDDSLHHTNGDDIDDAVYTASSAADELGLTDPTLRRILLIVIRMLSKLKQRALMPTVTSQHLHQWFSALEVDYNDIDFQCLIGEGGYGRVYRARYMHKHVACKVFRGGGGRQNDHGAVDQQQQQHISKDFWSELNTLARLRHPNITLLLGISLTPRYSLLTEYVPCGSLFDLLHRSHPGHKKGHEIGGWSLPRVVSIAREICLGMSYLHTHGVLHCDLKSSNVLISENWEVKICDFGLSFMTGESNRDAKLPLGCVGTHHWMAPEILRGEEYSQSADVYSFGMILWEMVYRMIPYAHLSALQVIGIVGYGHRVHHHGPSRPLLPMDDCPMPLRNIMMRSLRYVPATRPSFAELAAELSRLHKNSVIDVEESMNAFFGLDRPPYATIRQLSESELDDDIPKSGVSMVMFYAPNCPYCQSFKPFFENAVEKLAMHEPPIRFGMLDGMQYPNAIVKHGVPYYPTVKLFIDNQEHQLPLSEMDVSDPKCAAKVVNWVNRHTDREHVMETTGDLDKFIENNPFLAIGLFDDRFDGEFFKHSTRHFEDVFFATAYGRVAKEIVDHLYDRRKISSKPSGFPAIILLYHHDDHDAIYQGELDFHKVDRFILSRRVPMITEYTSEGAETLLSSGMPVLYLIRDKESQEGKEAEANMREVAKELVGSVLFSVCDAAGGHHIESLMNELGVDLRDAQQTPTARILYHPARESRHVSFFDESVRKFKPRQEDVYSAGRKLDKDFYRTFVREFDDGSLRPYKRSEPIPEYWGNEGVMQVVAENFDDVVMNDAQDVLVNYFAPWCGHCRQLSGIYSALGEKVKHLKSTLRIVKVDATQNELPLRVDAFPTIMLYPAGRKQSPVYFHGRRTVDHFIQFLKDNAVHEIRDKPAVYDAYGNMVESPEEL
ncbi:hypothetical protein FOZ62_008013 [Perkinsus olseni]|uniref:Uncharacterized protein n=1 Tax=Perkinsus olseni TaxID=32597 RepID=A0A7J6PVX5_PEROL|nr:hypothetical protein FOZ62_008013 [Perkinsus olseni]